MTETVLSKDILEKLNVNNIVPLVAYLTHESCQENGGVFELGGRWISKVRWQRSEGEFFGGKYGPEEVREKIKEIGDICNDDVDRLFGILRESLLELKQLRKECEVDEDDDEDDK